MKEEILQTISNYLDTIDIVKWNEWPMYMCTLYLQFNVDAWREISDKNNIKAGGKITNEMRIEIDTIIWRKLSEYYDRNKNDMPWNK